MKLCKLCCVGIVGIILSLIGFVLYTAFDLGEFYVINPFRLDRCKSIDTPQPGQECEDIQALSDGSMLISCGHLHDVLQTLSPHYIPFYNYQPIRKRISKLPESKKGQIYRIRSKDKYEKPIPMKIRRYAHPDFHPHGMSIVTNKNDQFLYIVNHRRDGEYLSVFKVDANKNELQYWTSITSDTFNFINGVAIIPDKNGNFYHTNWMKNDPGSWQGLFEMFGVTKTSQVQYCEIPNKNFFRNKPGKNVKAKCSVVVDELPDANGITLTNDNNKLFVVSSKHLLGYDIDTNDYKKLKLYCSIDTIYPCDNVNPTPDDNNHLYVGCFPQPLGLMYKIQNYPNANIAGMIRKINISEKTSEAFMIDPNGSLLSGTTAAFKIGPYTIGVSYFDDSRYMVCSDVTNIKIKM